MPELGGPFDEQVDAYARGVTEGESRALAEMNTTRPQPAPNRWRAVVVLGAIAAVVLIVWLIASRPGISQHQDVDVGVGPDPTVSQTQDAPTPTVTVTTVVTVTPAPVAVPPEPAPPSGDAPAESVVDVDAAEPEPAPVVVEVPAAPAPEPPAVKSAEPAPTTGPIRELVDCVLGGC